MKWAFTPQSDGDAIAKLSRCAGTEEWVLLEQTFVIDGESKVADVVKAAEKDAGAPIKVTRFVRYALGEGIEKQESDFAAEVAATAGVN